MTTNHHDNSDFYSSKPEPRFEPKGSKIKEGAPPDQSWFTKQYLLYIKEKVLSTTKQLEWWDEI
jgi:hypothetical protein